MTTLRNQKKRATRRALAEAAATLVLEGGTEALTVARITARAEVSPRTFHNYFSSTQEALLDFSVVVLETLAAEIRDFPEAMTATEVIEEIMLAGLGAEGVKLYSVMSIFRIGEALDSLNRAPAYKEKFEGIFDTFVDGLHPRLPDLERWEVKVVLHAAASAAVVALKEIRSLNDDTDLETRRNYLRRAFAVLRGIR